ncbi:MAG: hypothetical protein GF417_07145 [Candidatus Latescibacteria bacterium]|nr:hypothetical protein [bacterium]MBD3424195.1 hypothetical protein [Candidatus Latescibacterota bacterium]
MPMRKGYSSVTSLIISSLAIISIMAVGVSAQSMYEYSDDFSDDRVTTDSQDHSAIWETHPDISISGYLMFEDSPAASRSLAFHKGFAVCCWEAYVDYSFPLGEQQNAILSGSLEFDLYDMPAEDLYLIVDISYSDGSEGFYEILTSPGHYTFSIEPGAECADVDVKLSGMSVFLDNLHVELGLGETETESASWGSIKAIAGQ